MEDILMLVWIFSCVFAWAFAGSATSMGETIRPISFRKLVRSFSYTASVIAIVTTAILSPKFADAMLKNGFGMATMSFLLWSTIHLAGAVYTVGSFNYRLVSKTI